MAGKSKRATARALELAHLKSPTKLMHALQKSNTCSRSRAGAHLEDRPRAVAHDGAVQRLRHGGAEVLDELRGGKVHQRHGVRDARVHAPLPLEHRNRHRGVDLEPARTEPPQGRV